MLLTSDPNLYTIPVITRDNNKQLYEFKMSDLKHATASLGNFSIDYDFEGQLLIINGKRSYHLSNLIDIAKITTVPKHIEVEPLIHNNDKLTDKLPNKTRLMYANDLYSNKHMALIDNNVYYNRKGFGVIVRTKKVSILYNENTIKLKDYKLIEKIAEEFKLKIIFNLLYYEHYEKHYEKYNKNRINK